MKTLEWKKLSEEEYRAGWRKLVKRRFELSSGVIDDFDIYADGDTATCIALTTDRRVITVKHFRPGPERVLNELVGGFINADEDPQAAAERELLEETGYAGKSHFLGTSYFSAYNSGKKYIFMVEDCTKIQEAEPELLEDFAVELVDWTDVLEWGLSGETTDLDAILLADRYLKA